MLPARRLPPTNRDLRGASRPALAIACSLSFTVLAFTAALPGCGGAAFEAAPGDAGPDGDDGGADSSVHGDPGDAARSDAGSWCATQLSQYCEDFDEYTSVNGVFDTWVPQQSGGNFSFDTAGAISPPNALVASGSSGARLLVSRGFTAHGAATLSMRLAFDLRIDSPGSVALLAGAGLAAISFGSSIEDGYAALAIGEGSSLEAAWALASDAGASDAGAFGTAALSGGFPAMEQWAGHYVLEVDYGPDKGSAGCIQVFVGATPLLSPCLALPPQLGSPEAIGIALGDYASGFGGTGTIAVEFDNVTFDVK